MLPIFLVGAAYLLFGYGYVTQINQTTEKGWLWLLQFIIVLFFAAFWLPICVTQLGGLLYRVVNFTKQV